MHKVKVKNNPKSKKDTGQLIIIGVNTINQISEYFPFSKYSQIAVLTDTDTKRLWLPTLKKETGNSVVVITVPSGEKYKNLEQIRSIWKKMLDNNLDRYSLLINLGGGVISDMGGFAASTFMRGIDFLNIPTTLLAQADASIGGKTGFNFSGIKNLIGTFNQPKGTIVDTQTLLTLPKREFLSGFAEIIKHGLIRDENYFKMVTSKQPLLFTQEELARIIAKSCKIKTGIVHVDETEQGSRKILNFGHTVGHAVESLSLTTPNPLLHGEAVSIGMLTEATISNLLGLLPTRTLQQIRQVLVDTGLPISIPNMKIDKILRKMKSDKKNEKGIMNFTLLQGVGDAIYNRKVPESIVIKAIIRNL